jgi:hypothetical protein
VPTDDYYRRLFGLTSQPGPIETEEPSLFSRALEGVSGVLGATKSGVDYVARKSAANLFDVPEREGETVGQMLRSAVGLNPLEADSYGGRLVGKGLEFATDIATDPLTYATAGLGRAAQGGSKAAAALGKGSGLAFTGLMGAGALQEGSRAIDTIQREGFSPEAAEEVLGTALSGAGAVLGGTHLARGHLANRRARADAQRGIQGPSMEAPSVWGGESPLDLAQEPINLSSEPFLGAQDVWRGAAPSRAAAPLADVPVDILAERDFLRPDLGALEAAQQAGVVRDWRARNLSLNLGPIMEGIGAPQGAPRLSGPPDARLSTDAESALMGRPITRVEPATVRAPQSAPQVRPEIRAIDATEASLIADRIQAEDFNTLRKRLRTYERGLMLDSADTVRRELARRNAPVAQGAELIIEPQPEPLSELAPEPIAEPRYAFRARDLGEEGIPAVSHSQASLSEADVRRIAPSRSEGPQEVVRVDLNRLDPSLYEVIDRPDAPSWVRFREQIPETSLERMGELSAADRAAASKTDLLPPDQAQQIYEAAGMTMADPQAAQAVAEASGLTIEQAQKGAADIQADGVREFSPEAVAIKRASLGGAAAQEPVQVGAIAGERQADPASTAHQSTVANLTPETAAPERTFNPDATQPIPFNPDVTQPIPPVTVLNGRMPEPGNVKPATIFQPETRVPEGSISAKAAEGIPAQVEAIRSAGVEDFPLVQKEARKLIFDGDAALERMKTRAGQAKASEIGSATVDAAAHVKDLATYGASLIERGIRNFPEWSREMATRLGETVKDVGGRLREIYDQAVAMAKSAGAWMEERYGPSEQGAVRVRGPIKPIPDKPTVTKVTPAAKAGAPPAEPLTRNEGAIRNEALRETPEKPTLFDQGVEAWKSSLVSAPGTLAVANPLSNVGEAGMRAGEAGLAGLVDRALTAIHGGPRTRFSGEAVAQIKGGISRLPQAARALADGLKGALDSEGAIPGKAGKVIRVPLKMLEVGDAVTAQPNEGAALAGLAHREAQRTGKTAAERTRIERELTENPTPEMKATAEKEVRNRQFKGDDNPDSLIKKLINMRKEHKWLHVPFPFLETPVRLAELTIKRSPAGFWDAGKAYAAWRKAVKSGAAPDVLERLKGEAVDKITRPLIGTMILGTFAAYAKFGGMTGSGPTDPRQRGALKETGWSPYSFVIPLPDGRKAYVPFNRFEPISGVLGFAADAAEATNAKDGNDFFEKALASVAQNLTSKTYLQGLSDAAALIKDPSQFAGQYASNLAGSIVPNVVAKAAQSIDPAVRDIRPEEAGLTGLPERMGKAVMSRLPGVSKLLPERRSGTGEVITRPGNAATRLLFPIQPTATKPGKELEQLMADIGAVPGAPSKEVKANGRMLRWTDDEYKLLQDADLKATDALRRAVRSAGFRRMNAEDQKHFLDTERSKYRRAAKQKIMATPSFRRRALA